MRRRLHIHSNPGIAHDQLQMRARLKKWQLASLSFVQEYFRGLNRKFPAVRHRVSRIDYKINKHLFKLALIAFHAAKV